MTIEWLAGNRLRGTSAERTNTTGIGDTAGGWKEVGRTTLGSGNATIDVSSLPDKRYYMVLWQALHSGTYTQPRIRVGNGSADSGSNYGIRYNFNGGSDSASGSSADTGYPAWADPSTPNVPLFGNFYISNKSDKEKLGISHTVDSNTSGAGNAPRRNEGVFKYANTSNAIDTIQLFDAGSSSFGSGSEVVVLGWDPADTHTANFWEELASVEYSGGTALTSGSIPAKKYLWVQAYLKIASGTVDSNLWRFNADTGNNYAARYSRDGATDPTPNASISHMNINFGAGTRNNQLINMFIINNSANEKLVTGSGISQGTSGSGTAPNRLEFASKWANTTDQITSIQCTQGNSLNFEAGTIMKVWGSD